MGTEFIAPLSAIREPAAPVWSVEPGLPGHRGSAFPSLVIHGVSQLEQQLQTSQADLRLLAAGQADSVHAVMVQLEESRMSLQLMLQVRSRLLESYQELMRLQV